MKQLILFLTSITFITSTILAQAPNQFKYQAVLRDVNGNILAGQEVTIDIAILKGTAAGSSIFDETHEVTTSEQGLINLRIGSVNSMGGNRLGSRHILH